jgi:ribosomal protein S27E
VNASYRGCSHKFLGSNTCALCGWVMPEFFRPGPLADARAGDTQPPPPELEAPAASSRRVIIACPECGEFCVCNADGPAELICHDCGHLWAREPMRTPAGLVEYLRELLARDCDASRRRFYNAGTVLFAIAEAIDAMPEDVK